jgi:eukaryotic-like serine/threonine-protein kinase
MELVKGVPITDYCDKQRLPLRERLDLFMHVCQAVQHAHQKGIVHRDIKPSNVLVMLHDGQPLVKVIDFGIAKALHQPLTEKTIHTQFSQMIGTPLYMSPEQAEMGGLDIDTRSDIYSLGVLLYEMLTGTTPFDKQRLARAAYEEFLRIIRDEEPPRPSTRLSSLGDTATTVAINRGLDVRRLSQFLAGDLDLVVMKALEKDRNRRYDSASAFADDVERYLRDEAIVARPPSQFYRLRKFARRNRGSMIAAATVSTILVLATGFSVWQALRARHAEGNALAAADVAMRSERAAVTAAAAEKQAKDEAVARAAETEAVLDFVETRVIAAARPAGEAGGLGREVGLRKAIESSLPYVEYGFPGRPLIEARLRRTLADSFYLLGDTAKSTKQAESAVALYTRQLGPKDRNTLLSRVALANAYERAGRLLDGRLLQEETLALQKEVLGPVHRDTLMSMNDLATTYYHLGRRAEALALREKTLSLLKSSLGPFHVDTLKAMHNLALSYEEMGRAGEALEMQKEVLALRKAALGPEHPDTLSAMCNLAVSDIRLSRYADAIKLQEQTLPLQEAKLGPEHIDTLRTLINLALTYSRVGRIKDAIKLQEEAVARATAALGRDHHETLNCRSNLAQTYCKAARFRDAARLQEETWAIEKVRLGPDHPQTMRSMRELATIYAELGRYADALNLNEQVLALSKAKLGPEHPDTLDSMDDLARTYYLLNRFSEALKVYEQTRAIKEARLGADHPDTLIIAHNIGKCYEALGRLADALKLHKKTLELRKARLGLAHPDTQRSMSSLAAVYLVLGRYADALTLQEETLKLQQTTLGVDHPDALRTMFDIAESKRYLGRLQEALATRQQCFALFKARLGPDHADTLYAMSGLSGDLMALGRDAEALQVIDDCFKRAAGKVVAPDLIPTILVRRMQYFQKKHDADGCRQTAVLYESLKSTDAASLYNAACLRAITAAVLRLGKSANAARDADQEADAAMKWLNQAIAKGYHDVSSLKTDKDLDALRTRDDFKNLLAGLEKASPPPAK